jgi:hypothetical protein
MKGWTRSKRKVKTWQLGIAFVFLVLLSVYLLRQNNLKMVELRSAVVAADEKGVGVKESIESLNTHVFKHMNTKIVRPIELVHTYNRQVKAAVEGSRQIGTPEAYNQAVQLCQSRGIPASSLAQCAVDYLVGTGQATGQNAPALPDKNLFIYSFASPRWTPDLAGWTVLITGVIGGWLLTRLVEFIIIRLVLRRRIKSGF